MELKIRDGEYVLEGGHLARAEGREALLQRVLFKLTARRGAFPFLPELGSRLHSLGRTRGGERQSAAEQYVAEALAGEKDLQVEAVTLVENERLRVELSRNGEGLALELTMGA